MKSIKLSIWLLSIGIVLSSCKAGQEKEEQADALRVTVQKATSIEKTTQLQFPGKVKADDKLILSTKVFGQIERVYVDKGEKVRQGQLLVKIRNNDILSQMEAAKASHKEASSILVNTKKNFERIKRLYKKGSATQRELDDMNTALQVQKAKVESINHSIQELNELLTYTNLRSPINGFISQKFANKGTMATPGNPLIAIESLDDLKVEITVPEFEIGLFEEGDSVSIEVNAVGEKHLKGFVKRIIASSAFSGGAQYQVLIEFKESNESIKPGMFARVNLLKNKELRTIVPHKAIFQRGQLSGLFTVNQQGEAMLRWVRLGKKYPEGIEVISGLQTGEQFIVSSESKLTDGVKVEVTKNI